MSDHSRRVHFTTPESSIELGEPQRRFKASDTQSSGGQRDSWKILMARRVMTEPDGRRLSAQREHAELIH